MQILLDHGANAFLLDQIGLGALYACCQNGHVAAVELLYKYGARNELLHDIDGKVSLRLNHKEFASCGLPKWPHRSHRILVGQWCGYQQTK
jgi:ankyrin repeat protein